jgi:ribonuclease HI
VYSDASWTGGKSQSGYIIQLQGAKGSRYVLEACSKKQATVSTSSGEAEAIALAFALKAALRVGGMLDEIRNKPIQMVIYCDNTAVITACKNGMSHKMGHLKKHIGLSFQFISEVTDIEFVYVKSGANIADMLTKALPTHINKTLCSEIFTNI